MRYWPLNYLRHSPSVPAAFAWELSRFYTHPPSESAFEACIHAAQHTRPAPMPGLAIIESVGAPHRFVFTEYPTWEEWCAFERAGVVEADDGRLCLVMDCLH